MALIRLRDLFLTFESDGRVLIRSGGTGRWARAPGLAGSVLAMCSQPRERDEVERELGSLAVRIYDGLGMVGLLVNPDTAGDTPCFFKVFAGLEIHRRMLADEPRIAAYRAALQATIRPGDVVIDAGSGSGVLATLAALAGARKVYAVDRTDFADVARQVAHDSGVGDKVEVVRANFGEVTLPEKARVIVTETFGHLALVEGAMPDIRACADRNLAPDGVVIPSALSLHVAPMRRAPDRLVPLLTRQDGLNLSCLRQDLLRTAMSRTVSPSEVGPTIDLGRLAIPGDSTFQARFSLDEPCRALCGWFTLYLAPGIDLPTSPHDPDTSWKQTVLPFALGVGEHTLRARPLPEDKRGLLVNVNGWEVHVW